MPAPAWMWPLPFCATIDRMVDLAMKGTTELSGIQTAALARAGVDLASLLVAR